MASSKDCLKKFLEIPFILHYTENYFQKVEEVDTVHSRGQIILTSIRYIAKLLSHFEEEEVTDLSTLSSLNEEVNVFIAKVNCLIMFQYEETHVNIDGWRSMMEYCIERYLEVARSFQGLFSVPEPKMSSHSNTLITSHEVFIEFLLEILDKIEWKTSDLKDQSQTLQMELKSLVTATGDEPCQATYFEETNNVWRDIERVVNLVGSFLYSLFFTEIDQARMGKSLPDLLKEFEILNIEIEEHCRAVSKIQTDVPTKTTPAVSLFVVDSLLDDLKDLMNHKADMIVELKDQFSTIHDELLGQRSLLRSINMQQHPEFQEIVVRVRDITYEVEYILPNSSSPVRYLAFRLSHIIEKIRDIKMDGEKMMKRNDSGERHVAEYSIEKELLQDPKPQISEDIIVGFEKETTEIVGQLIRGPADLQIVSIFGMPGLGKTTLAKKIYKNSFIVDYFDKLAWCVVSQTHQKRNILNDILTAVSHLNKDRISNMEEDRLKEELYKSLKGRGYLIVMDDIWNIEAWDDFRIIFPNDKCGSRILFTTRIRDVALQASPQSIIKELPFLSKVECWDLLKWKLFQKKNCPAELLDIGKQIALSCGGLPLAIVVVAAILANMEKKEREWLKVAQSLNSHIYEDKDKCMDILELSYNHLPLHLRPCFLYFGVFPEDMEIPVRNLLALWISEGFIEKKAHKSLDEVAQDYLVDLISRSLVLVAKRRYDGQIKACNMHDLLRDVCLRIAEKENFLKVSHNQLLICKKNYVSVAQCYLNPSYMRPTGLHVRPLSNHSPHPSTFVCHSMNRLRVFNMPATDLKYYDLVGTRPPVHLKYFADSQTPTSIARLQNLEYLLVDNNEIAQIHDTLLSMVKLRYLHFIGGAQFNESCHIRVSNNEFLTNNLENISFLLVYEENDEKILRCSPNLRRLKCAFKIIWDLSRKRYRYPNLNFLNHLESLNVSFHRSFVTNTSPGLIIFPPCLKKLTLQKFDISWEQMSIIGRLELLEILKLKDVALEGKQWQTSEGEFLQLKFLELEDIKISDWNASSDHFPLLERLVLRKCHHLKNIPGSLGDILTLQIIEVDACRNSVAQSAKQIQDEQRELGNEVLKVVISRSQVLRRFTGNPQH